MTPVEICVACTSIEAVRQSVEAAYVGGAQTVELCRAMDVAGLTPAAAHVRTARRAFRERPGVFVMIRPRPGDFVYTRAERAAMHASIHRAAEAGADGVVFGALRPDHYIDEAATAALVATARAHGLRTTFHRAFDATPDPAAALDLLLTLGSDRVLTSGTPWGSGLGLAEGQEALLRLAQQAAGRIELVLSGGVVAETIHAQLVPFAGQQVSVHAFSSVQQAGCASRERVAALVAACG